MRLPTNDPANHLTLAAYTLLGATLLYTVHSLVAYALGADWEQGSFQVIEKIKMLPGFGDLRWLTATSECGVNLKGLYSNKLVGCDPYGRQGIYYPPMGIWMARLLHVKGSHTGAIGLATGLTFVSTLFLTTKELLRRPWSLPLVISLFLFSFPVQFALERQNFDVFVFLVVTTSCLMMSWSGTCAQAMSGVLAFLAVSLQSYPAAGYMGWAILGIVGGRIQKGRNLFLALAVITGTILGLIFSIPFLGEISKSTDIGDGGIVNFGLRAFDYMSPWMTKLLGSDMTRLSIQALMLTKFVVLLSSFWISSMHSLYKCYLFDIEAIRKLQWRRFQDLYFSIMTWIWLGCYLLTISNEYRSIFLLPGIANIASMLENGAHNSRSQKTLLVTLLTAAIVILLFPLTAFSPVSQYSAAHTIIEIGVEFILLPFLAGSLGAILIGSSIAHRRLRRPAIE
jgi:hypothetical protein